MASAGKDCLPEKHTGFTFRGIPIVLSKTRGAPPSNRNKKGWYTEKKKIEVLTIFAACGILAETSRLTGVPKQTIRFWLREDWAKDILNEIRNENDQVIDSKFTELVGASLNLIGDRLQNGDSKVLRDGTLVKVPVSARDLAIITAINIDKRQLLRGKPTVRTEQVSEGSRLQKLEQMFLKLANNQKKEPIVQEEKVIEGTAERVVEDNNEELAR